MEGLAVASSVLAVAEVGLKLSSTIYQYSDQVRHADARIKQLGKQVGYMGTVIDQFGQVFKTEQTQTIVTKKTISTTKNMVRDCSDLFSELRKIIEKGMSNRWTWPFRQSTADLHMANLERLKTTLQCLMAILTHGEVIASREKTSETAKLRAEIAKLAGDRDTAVRKYQSLKNQQDDIDVSSSSLSGDRQPPGSARKPQLPSAAVQQAAMSTILAVRPGSGGASLSAGGRPRSPTGATPISPVRRPRSREGVPMRPMSSRDLKDCRRYTLELLDEIEDMQDTLRSSDREHLSTRPQRQLVDCYRFVQERLDRLIFDRRMDNLDDYEERSSNSGGQYLVSYGGSPVGPQVSVSNTRMSKGYSEDIPMIPRIGAGPPASYSSETPSSEDHEQRMRREQQERLKMRKAMEEQSLKSKYERKEGGGLSTLVAAGVSGSNVSDLLSAKREQDAIVDDLLNEYTNLLGGTRKGSRTPSPSVG